MNFTSGLLHCLSTLTLIFTVVCTSAQSQILLDGTFDDWSSISGSYTDATGDGGNSGIDFKKINIHNNREYVFLYLEVGSEINLQDLNDIAVYIDIDNNANTGTRINGVGAEITYSFGDRSGTYNGSRIGHANIGIITAPTVTSSTFEIAINRNLNVNGTNIFIDNTVNVMFKDNAINGDIAPNISGGLAYQLTDHQQPSLPSYQIAKHALSDLRILSYNVERDGFFEANREAAYTRILQAVQPDIIGFQEIYGNTSLQVANRVEAILPSATDVQWFHSYQEPDCHAISRYPITKSAPIPGSSGSGNAAFLIDIPDTETDMLFIVAHPPCCNNNTGRQLEVDRIMQFVREAKLGNGPIPIQENAPIVIVGDMNFVGDGNQLQTLLTGNIADEASFGTDFTPDWDGSNLQDSEPYSTGVPFSYTWYSPGSSFSPGKLDYILYSGSNLQLENTYSLFTPGLQSDSLTKYNLEGNDVIVASDHLPVVSDFSLKNKTTIGINELDNDAHQLVLSPNPVSAQASLSFNHTGGLVHLYLIGSNGKELVELYNEILTKGDQQIAFDLSDIRSGIYTIRLITKEGTSYKRLMVVR